MMRTIEGGRQNIIYHFGSFTPVSSLGYALLYNKSCVSKDLPKLLTIASRINKSYPMIPNDRQEPLTFSHRIVTKNDILPTHQHATSFVFEHCTSKTWGVVGKTLATLPQLKELTLRHCNTGISLYKELPLSKSLLKLRVGTSVSMQSTVDCLSRESTLSQR